MFKYLTIFVALVLLTGAACARVNNNTSAPSANQTPSFTSDVNNTSQSNSNTNQNQNLNNASGNATNNTKSANTNTASAPQTAIMSINNFNYVPGTLTVAPGARLTITNQDVVSHSVTSKTTGLFDSGLISKDGTTTLTAPTAKGEYEYYCTIHPSMSGVLVVQ